MTASLQDWPAWARWVAAQRLGLEIGVGDTVERLLGSGGRLIKATLLTMGIDCGCGDRRRRWNELYAYEQEHNGQ